MSKQGRRAAGEAPIAGGRLPAAFPWVVTGALMLFSLLCYNYTDIQLIARHAMNLWDVLARGELFSFYRTGVTLSIGATVQHTGEVPYDIWVYLPFALWDLPVYLWEKATGLTFEANALALLWVRCSTLAPAAGTVWALNGIAGDLGCDHRRRRQALWLFCSSLFLLNGTFCVGQIDIFSVFFTLLGLRAYLSGKHRAFVGWFALAVTFKNFGLFVFVPLLLLRQKRPLALVRDGVLVCSLTLVSKLLFLQDKLQTPTGFDEGRFLERALERGLDLGNVRLPLLALLVAALWLFCWLRPGQDGRQTRWAVWAYLAGYASFFLSANICPYWEALLAPCAALLLLSGWPGEPLLLLDSLAGGAFFARAMLTVPRLYDAKVVWWSPAGFLLARHQGSRLENLAYGLREQVLPVAEAVCFVLLAAMVLRFCPALCGDRAERGGEPLPLDLTLLRLALAAGFVVLPMAGYLLG